MDYAFAADFGAADLGAFTAPNKLKVWTDPATVIDWDDDPTGRYFEIVADDRFPGGRACRNRYPKGEHGTGTKRYVIRAKCPETAANLEFLVLFEAGFSFMTPNADKRCVGKIGPQIQWGETGGATEGRGTRSMFIWNGGGSLYPNPVICPTLQDQRSGNQLVQPPFYGPRIATEQVYKLRSRIMGGPEGYAMFWINDELVAEVGPQQLHAGAADDVNYDFAFWAGGASWEYAPEYDSYTRHGGIRYWSGEADQPDLAPPVLPPNEAILTLTLGGTTYAASGHLNLTPLADQGAEAED